MALLADSHCCPFFGHCRVKRDRPIEVPLGHTGSHCDGDQLNHFRGTVAYSLGSKNLVTARVDQQFEMNPLRARRRRGFHRSEIGTEYFEYWTLSTRLDF